MLIIYGIDQFDILVIDPRQIRGVKEIGNAGIIEIFFNPGTGRANVSLPISLKEFVLRLAIAAEGHLVKIVVENEQRNPLGKEWS